MGSDELREVTVSTQFLRGCSYFLEMCFKDMLIWLRGQGGVASLHPSSSRETAGHVLRARGSFSWQRWFCTVLHIAVRTYELREVTVSTQFLRGCSYFLEVCFKDVLIWLRGQGCVARL